jgi:hypothetical protein
MIKRLAIKLLRHYRLARKMGYNPSVARSHAWFMVVCNHGVNNLYAQNKNRKYQMYWEY